MKPFQSRQICTLAILAALSACESRSDLEQISREKLERYSKDPLSIQIRNVRRVGNDICGEANAKDDLGNYKGFYVFRINPEEKGYIVYPYPIRDEETENALRLCASESQKSTFNEEQQTVAYRYHRKIEEEAERVKLETLKLELRLRELESE